MSEKELYDFLSKNKEWIFSGIGITLLTFVASSIFSFINRKKKYVVCIKISDENDFKAIRVGWSWAAFFFDIWWAIYHRLYDVVLIYSLSGFAVYFHFLLINYLFDLSQDYHKIEHVCSIALFCIKIFFGIHGNSLVVQKYCHSYFLFSPNVYVEIRTVIASSKMDAISIVVNNT